MFFFRLPGSTGKEAIAVIVGDRLGGQLTLPAQIQWKKGGLRYLGVFLGGMRPYTNKNWDGVIQTVKGRLNKWRWLLPKVSYRGRVLIANNLVSSSFWHRLPFVDPPVSLLSQIQSILGDFIGTSYTGFLSVEERGKGLVYLASR